MGGGTEGGGWRRASAQERHGKKSERVRVLEANANAKRMKPLTGGGQSGVGG